MPKLNLNDSVESVSIFVIGCDREKFNGPTAVNQSTPIPAALLTLFYSSIELE